MLKILNFDLSIIPNRPGVYFFEDGKGKKLYIGKAKDLNKRISQYFAKSSVWKLDMLTKARKIDFIEVNNEQEALLLENNLISRYMPSYNSLLKGDNSYSYIKITNEDFPQILFTRFRDSDGSIYIGPKSGIKELKKIIQYLRLFLGYRMCGKVKFKKGELCSDFYFGLCKGWCKFLKQSKVQGSKAKDEKIKDNIVAAYMLRKSEKTKYNDNLKGMNIEQIKKFYNDMIKVIAGFFNGDNNLLEKEILNEINNAVKDEKFEYAAKLRDIYIGIEKYSIKQSVVFGKTLTGKFVSIRTIGNYYVRSLISLYEGKIIDVIRLKDGLDDIELETLKLRFVNELGEMSFFREREDVYGYTNSLKNILIKEKKEIIKLAEKFIDSYIVSTSFENENLLNDLLIGLQKKYNLRQFPYRIEAIDISHLGGSWISGALGCMVGGIIFKKGYRRYKIQSVKKGDDYASLKELIIRRFKLNVKTGVEYPNLFILDGGKGQLSIIKKIYSKNKKFKKIFGDVDFIGLGKGESRTRKGKIKGQKESVFKFDEKLNIVEIKIDYDEFDKVLLKVRDEAHRFANAYRKKQMEKERRGQ